MLAFYQPKLGEGINFLDPEESNHCARVLRMKKGDNICLLDGNGKRATAKITITEINKVEYQIISEETIPPKSYFVHLAISPTKNQEKLEWCIEKCTEIGVDMITLISCSNSERNKVRFDRLEKKAISALKQSMNPFLPVINNIQPFSSFVENAEDKQKLICFVDAKGAPLINEVAVVNNSYCVMIGPEGDFTNEELNQAKSYGFSPVSLGNNTLRTETAGIFSVAALNLLNF